MSDGKSNGELLKEIHETVIELKTKMESFDRIVKVFEPNGTCDRSRRRLESIGTYVKAQWWLIGLIVGALVVSFVKGFLA